MQVAIALIRARDPQAVLKVVHEELCTRFQVQAVALCVVHTGRLPEELAALLPVHADSEARQALGGLLDLRDTFCGVLRPHQFEFLFPEQAGSLASAVLKQLPVSGGVLLLSMGSTDAEYFAAGQGTLFVDFLGEILQQCLHQALPEGDDEAVNASGLA